jgi:hypothetical protein
MAGCTSGHVGIGPGISGSIAGTFFARAQECHASPAESSRPRFARPHLCCYTGGMTMPFAVPDWLPWWAIIAILVPVLVYLLAFLVMPFNVFGLRSRLDLIDARLDEIQGEIRALAVRLPEPSAGPHGTLASRPPIPPAPSPGRPPPSPSRWSEPQDDPPDSDPSEVEPGQRWRRAVRPRPDAAAEPRPPRSEPRLDWPR